MLFDCVVGELSLGVGEVRLIGQTKDKLGRTKFNPEATQVNRQTLVVIHLRSADINAARPDVNIYSDFNRDGPPAIQDRDDLNDDETDEAKEGFKVVLTDIGSRKLDVVKEVKLITALRLNEAKKMVESCPVTIESGLTREACEEIRVKIAAAGGTAEIRRVEVEQEE